MPKTKLYSYSACKVCIGLILFAFGEIVHLANADGSSAIESSVQNDFLATTGEPDENESHRDSRLFRFWPGFAKPTDNGGDACTVGTSVGTCQTKQYCNVKGGTILDYTSCKGSHTICCQLNAINRCQTEDPCTIKDSSILLTNVNGGTHQRHYVFPKLKGVCQLKLNVVNFELAPPNDDGVCNVDSLTITGSSTVKHFNLCGSVYNQELFLDFGSSDKINVNINVRNSGGARYSILPTFIRCDSSKRAPSHCLQYFTTMKGTVRSFNYNASTGMHLSNLDYNVCIKAFDDTSSITWTACNEPNMLSSFVITGNPNNGTMLRSGEDCITDWVSIYGENRHCGTSFGTATSTAKPFLLNVHFDATEFSLLSTIGMPNGCGIPNFPNLMCSDATGVCVCQVPVGGGDFSDFLSSADLLNTGFCLDYSQDG